MITTAELRLGDLAGVLQVAELPAEVRALPLQGVTADSREVQPGDVFVAVPGTQVDGADFAPQAVAKGAALVIAARPLELDAPCVVVPDPARALGDLADAWLDRPSREVEVLATTGTNGKTSTSFLIAHLLDSLGHTTSVLGTVVNRIAGQATPARQTTPDALTLHRALARTRALGGRYLALEASSHALDQRRLAGVRIRVGVFTNLTRDHLDYHGSMKEYFAAKARLFDDLLPGGVAVLNARDPYCEALAERTPARVVRYAIHRTGRPPQADLLGFVGSSSLDGTELELRLGTELHRTRIPWIGAFNAENALAAVAAAHAVGAPLADLARALEHAPVVPGRMERVRAEAHGPAVLVDYAHTPDALQRVCETLRPLTRGRLIVVFGCGGDRDRGKRAPMGRAVERHADHAWLTTDNPRSEDPDAIAADVLAGLDRPQAVRIEHDRAAAIRHAVASARPEDLVLIAGKGHEVGQTRGEVTIPFDDRDHARRALREVA